MTAPAEYDEAKGIIAKENKRTQETDVEMIFNLDSLRIKAERLFYRLRPDWLDRKQVSVVKYHAPDAIPAFGLRGNWRQCSGCCNAWEKDPLHVFSVCPAVSFPY